MSKGRRLLFIFICIGTSFTCTIALPIGNEPIIDKDISPEKKIIMNNDDIDKPSAKDTLPSTKSDEKRIAKLDEPFILKQEQAVSLDNDEIEIELTMCMHEWGYTGPPEAEDSEYFDGVQYYLTLKIGGIEELSDFYESEQLGDRSTIEVGDYTLTMLSSGYSTCQIEVVVTKK